MDIDYQAVETTKLSLLLKVVEDESEYQLELLKQRVLPDLGNNIKCGNSLIDPEFYQTHRMASMSDTELFRINTFNWQKAFPEVFAAGGFDVAIGNPPYIRIQNMTEFAPIEVEYYKAQYDSGSDGNFDIYVLFVQRGMQLLKEEGLLGYILPHKFFNADYGGNLRQFISENQYLKEVIHFGHQQIFDTASTYTCLLFLSKQSNKKCTYQRVYDLQEWRIDKAALPGSFQSKELTSANWLLIPDDYKPVFKKVDKVSTRLNSFMDRIFQGLKTSADPIYILKLEGDVGQYAKVYSKHTNKYYELESDLLHPLIKGGDSASFCMQRSDLLILFPYQKVGDSRTSLLPQQVLSKEYPNTWEYLCENKEYLENRERGRFRGEGWYQYGRSQALDVMPLPKIFTPDIAVRSSFSIDETGDIFFTGGVAGGYGLLIKDTYPRDYVLGLLNSKLLQFYLQQISTAMRGGYYSYESRFIKHIPIIWKDRNKEFKEQRQAIEDKVETIISLKGKIDQSFGHQQDVFKRQAEAADQQLNEYVYALYGLNKDEIQIVEHAKS